jgi:hypothetical protein
MFSRAVMFVGIFWVSCLSADAAEDLKWQSESGYRWAPLSVATNGKPGFTLLPAEATGVVFSNVLSTERRTLNANLLNGSGVALGDYDGDGLCDVYLCNLGGTNSLFRNLGGWKFKDVTRETGVECAGQTSTGAVFADVNGDGNLDLLVTSMGGPNALFLSLGQGRFTNATAAAGLVSRWGSTTMALGDINGDGTLDLYVANYGATSILRSGGYLAVSRNREGKLVVGGRYAQRIKIIDGVLYELGEPSALYLNDGRANFKPVSWTDGSFTDENAEPLASAFWDQGLTVVFRDINGDLAPDIYVCKVD